MNHFSLSQYWRILSHQWSCAGSADLLLFEVILFAASVPVERRFGSVKYAVRPSSTMCLLSSIRSLSAVVSRYFIHTVDHHHFCRTDFIPWNRAKSGFCRTHCFTIRDHFSISSPRSVRVQFSYFWPLAVKQVACLFIGPSGKYCPCLSFNKLSDFSISCS